MGREKGKREWEREGGEEIRHSIITLGNNLRKSKYSCTMMKGTAIDICGNR